MNRISTKGNDHLKCQKLWKCKSHDGALYLQNVWQPDPIPNDFIGFCHLLAMQTSPRVIGTSTMTFQVVHCWLVYKICLHSDQVPSIPEDAFDQSICTDDFSWIFGRERLFLSITNVVCRTDRLVHSFILSTLIEDYFGFVIPGHVWCACLYLVWQHQYGCFQKIMLLCLALN